MVSGRDGTSRDLKIADGLDISVTIQPGGGQFWQRQNTFGEDTEKRVQREQAKIKQRYTQHYLQGKQDEPIWLGMVEFPAMATVFFAAGLLAAVSSILAFNFESRIP